MKKSIIIHFESTIQPINKGSFFQKIEHIESIGQGINEKHELLQSLSAILMEMLKAEIHDHSERLPDCQCRELELFKSTLAGMQAAYEKTLVEGSVGH